MSTTPARRFDTDLPDAKGYFGPYGGQLVPPVLKQAMLSLIDADYLLKTGQGGEELLEHVVISLCA